MRKATVQRLIFLLCAFTSVAVAQSKPTPIELPPGNVKSKPRRIGITAAGLKGGENLDFATPINDVKRLLVATPGAAIKNFPNEPEPKEAQSETAQKVTMEGQKICSEQADNVLQKTKRMPGNDDKYVTLNVANHYDPSMSICFVEISKSRRLPRQIAEAGTFTKASLTESDGELRAFSIEDAFGGNTVGELIQVFPYEHPPQICKIQPPGQPEIHCASDTEFRDLAFKYFGISK